MEEFRKRWRIRMGLLSLAASLVLTAAWIQSAFDLSTLGSLNGPHGDPIPKAGKIAILQSTNPTDDSGDPPQSNWTLTGLFTVAHIMVAPWPENYGSPEADRLREIHSQEPSIPSTTLPGQMESLQGDGIQPANYVEQTPIHNEITPTSAENREFSLSDPSRSPIPQGSFQPTDLILDSDFEEGPVTVLAQWSGYGFYYTRYIQDEAGSGMCLLIPHASIALPLWLLSAGLLWPMLRNRSKPVLPTMPTGTETTATAVMAMTSNITSSTAAISTIPSPSGAASTRSARSAFPFRRFSQFIGIASLAVSLALMAGWVRSRFVTDVVRVPCDDHQYFFASGRDGLSWKSNDASSGGGLSYRLLQGAAHERFTFRPEEPSFEVISVPESAAPGPMFVGHPRPGIPMVDSGSSSVPSSLDAPNLPVKPGSLDEADRQDETNLPSAVRAFVPALSHSLPADGQPTSISLQDSSRLPGADSVSDRHGVSDRYGDLDGDSVSAPGDDPIATVPSDPLPGDTLPGDTVATVPVAVIPGGTAWYGASFAWNGLYVSSGNTLKSVVIPYGFLVIPLTLVSAMLLLKRRSPSSG